MTHEFDKVHPLTRLHILHLRHLRNLWMNLLPPAVRGYLNTLREETPPCIVKLHGGITP